jgi:hypothetical protein
MIAVPLAGKSSVSAVVARIFVSGFGGLALAWALFTIPIFLQHSAVEKIGKQIIAGDSFKIAALASTRPTFVDLGKDKWSRPSVLSAAAIIDLRLLEQAIADSDQKNLDSLMSETDGMIRRSLANTPTDAFLWMILFWLENTQNGFKRTRLNYLQMSYRLGPNEGWIAVKRNRLAVAIFPSLPPDIAENAVSEFGRLVGSNFFAEAADIFAGPGWPIGDTLLSGLKDVDELNRQTFAKFIYRLGYDVLVPGIERPDWRPWH